MNIFRKILFYIFFTVYLAVCPPIIFYALGYIFTPKVEEGFIKTGLIHVETLPENASCSIAGRRYTEKTPVTIRNLLAGQYDIKITLEGYRPWARRVTVEPGKAANFEKVLLVPKKLKTRTLSNRSFEALWPIPETRYLFLKSSAFAEGLQCFDSKHETIVPVFPANFPFARARVEKIFMVRESSFVLIQLGTPQGSRFLGCQLDKERPEIKDLSALFTNEQPREISWEGGRPEVLFVLYGQNLARLDLERMKTFPDFFKKIRGFGLYKNKIYALRASSIVRTGVNAKKGDETPIEKGIFLDNLFQGNQKFKIDFISNVTICFTGERGEFFSNRLPYRFVDEGVKGYQAGEDGRKVVLWQEGRVGILNFEKPERKKEFFERGPEIEWVFNGGENIRQAYFVYDAAYVLFCEGQEVFLVRLGEGGGPAEALVTVKEGSSIFYFGKTGKLYYLEPLRGEFVAADILPEGITLSGMFSELEKETQGVMK